MASLGGVQITLGDTFSGVTQKWLSKIFLSRISAEIYYIWINNNRQQQNHFCKSMEWHHDLPQLVTPNLVMPLVIALTWVGSTSESSSSAFITGWLQLQSHTHKQLLVDAMLRVPGLHTQLQRRRATTHKTRSVTQSSYIPTHRHSQHNHCEREQFSIVCIKYVQSCWLKQPGRFERLSRSDKNWFRSQKSQQVPCRW